MDEERVIYQLVVEDIVNIAEEKEIDFNESEIDFIEDKVGEFIDWRSAIEFGLEVLESERNKK